MTIPRVLRGIPLLVYIKGGEGGASIFRSFSRHVVKERRGWLFNATAWKGPKITGPFWFNETIDFDRLCTVARPLLEHDYVYMGKNFDTLWRGGQEEYITVKNFAGPRLNRVTECVHLDSFRKKRDR